MFSNCLTFTRRKLLQDRKHSLVLINNAPEPGLPEDLKEAIEVPELVITLTLKTAPNFRPNHTIIIDATSSRLIESGHAAVSGHKPQRADLVKKRLYPAQR